MKKIFTIITFGILLVALTNVGFITSPNRAMAISIQTAQTVDTSGEYSNGTIGSPTDPVVVWYAWINNSGCQVIYMACLSYMYPPPTITFFGEHYWTENGTEMFVGNTLTVMEVYNDTNGNQVPDETNELLYTYFVNSSQSFTITPIEKTVTDGVSHYKWGLRYNTVDGAFINANQATTARVMLDYLGSSYDFYVQDNVSYLKTSLEMGKVLNITSTPGFDVSLDGLGLSVLYQTTVDASQTYTAVVNGEPYNSTTTQNMAEPTQSGEIRVGDTKAFQCVFGQNYTLYNDSQPTTYQSESAAISDQNVLGSVGKTVGFALGFFEQLLSGLVPQITNNLPAVVNLDYNASSLLYRVCYPQWNGYALEHDPTYLAYLTPSTVSEISLSSPPQSFIVAAIVIGSIALLLALQDVRRTRKTNWPPHHQTVYSTNRKT